ncbi:tetratricopeptide repeat protein, partial [Streptomyces sp. HSW2009]|uniref:tetratricopeptide repeat protein n=1 Tax=Streptomyces sp. HSW2009 TaxID=3142890 RepID=UPI0032EE6E7C
ATPPDPGGGYAAAAYWADTLPGGRGGGGAPRGGGPGPALSTFFGPEVRAVDTQVFVEEAEPGWLGAHGGPRRGRRARAAGAVSGGSGGGPGGAGGAGSGVPAVPGQPSPHPGGVPLSGTASATAGAGGTGAGAAGGPVPGGASAGGAGRAVAALDVRAAVLALPVPHVDPGDANAGFLATLLAAAPAELSVALAAAPTDSTELRLRRVRVDLERGRDLAVDEALDALEARHQDDWRIVWYRGLQALVSGDHGTAARSFDAVYDAFPGEPAPKVALGLCAEVLDQLDNAAAYYHLVWATDPGFVSTAFGLARVRFTSGDRAGAVAALESVPESSIHYTAARVAAVRARLRQDDAPQNGGAGAGAGGGGARGSGAESSSAGGGGAGGGGPAQRLAELTAAAEQVERLADFGLDAVRRERLHTEVLGSALDWVLSSGSGTPQAAGPGAAAGTRPSLLGSRLDERGLRFGLERSYRVLARLAQRGEERIELVERANRLRPRTWV